MFEGLSLTPREAAARLGIPASTLRAYATEFQPLLSASAGGTSSGQDRTVRHRRYSEADLVVLSRAQTLLESGLSYTGTRDQLGFPSREVARARRPASNRATGRASPRSSRAKAGEAEPPSTSTGDRLNGPIGSSRASAVAPSPIGTPTTTQNPGGSTELRAIYPGSDHDPARALELAVLEELALRLRSIEATQAEHGQQLLEIGRYLTSRAEKTVQQEPTFGELIHSDLDPIETPREPRRGLLGWLARRLA